MEFWNIVGLLMFAFGTCYYAYMCVHVVHSFWHHTETVIKGFPDNAILALLYLSCMAFALDVATSLFYKVIG